MPLFNKQVWDDLEFEEEIRNARHYPHVLAASKNEKHQLLMAPTDLHPKIEPAPRIEIVEPEGLVKLEMLQPIWEWVGHPPVLQLKVVGWRASEDLRVALEVERQIREQACYDWEERFVRLLAEFTARRSLFNTL